MHDERYTESGGLVEGEAAAVLARRREKRTDEMARHARKRGWRGVNELIADAQVREDDR